MSLISALNSAVSGLSVAQAQLSQISDNVSNVNTAGYTRKVVDQQSQVMGGIGTGVSVADIKSITNAFLNSQLQTVTSSAQSASVVNQWLGQVQSLLGNPTGNTTILASLNQMFTALAALQSNPSSTTAQSSAVDAINNFGSNLGTLASSVQSYRQQIDQQVASDVTSINSDIKRIDSLNQQIASLSASGSNTAALQDQRTQALNDLSQYVDIRTYTLPNGGVGVTTTNGVALLDSSVHQLVYSAAGTVDASTQFTPITVNQVDPGTGVVQQTGVALNGEGQTGSLGALLTLRDSTLPNLAAQLGEIGAETANQLNAVHNGNSTVPPPNTLTGQNTGLANSDLQGFTGQTTFYVFNSSNAVAASTTVNFSTEPAGTTIGQVINQVNTALAGSGTLALTNGVLTFTGAAGAGVAIKDGSPASSRGGESFAQFFGMNNLVTTAVPGQYNTGLTTADQSGFSGNVTLELIGPNNTTAGTYTLDFNAPPLSSPGATMNDVINQLNTGLGKYGTFGLNSSGALTFQTNSAYSGDTLAVSQDTSTRLGTGVTFSQMFGIGANSIANAAQNFQVRSDISANPSLLSLAQVDTAAAAGTPALTAGDPSGALALQQVALNTVSFPGAGGLPAVQSTLSDYVGTVLGTAAQAAAQAKTTNTDQTTLQSTVQNQVSSVSGVNLDEEMSNMVVYQNAYNASAQMIAAVGKLFNTLMADVQAA